MDRTAKLWHLEYTFPLRIYAGHEKDVDVVRFHPNCNYLATAGADKTVRLWSHADAKMVSYIVHLTVVIEVIQSHSFYITFCDCGKSDSFDLELIARHNLCMFFKRGLQ
jgi:WD40 repeat protein